MTQPSAPDTATSPLTPDTPAGRHRPRLSQALQLDTRYSLWREWRRPWKLFALACGIGLLVIGRYLMPAPDWDIPISFIMGLMAYACASWCLRVFLARDWPMWPLAIFLSWFTIDGCYAWYWSQVDPQALALMRDVNAPASGALFGMCALVWLYNGSLRELWADLRAWLRPARSG